MPSVADLRRNYTFAGLSEADAGADPIALFRAWFDAAVAADLPEPNALTLATVGPGGVPSARVVLLKGFDERGFVFYSNFASRKGRELTANPHAALVFLWHPLERQVRIEGVAEQVSPAEADAYFASRPLGSRLGAWASPQSEVVRGADVLHAEHAALSQRYPDGNVPRPPHWGGYRVVPSVVEFWQGRPSRLHDRIRFRRADAGWVRERLAP